MCENRESQLPFNWQEKMKVKFVNEEVGAGIFSTQQLPAEEYLGHVSGKAVTLQEENKKIAKGLHDYMFRVATNKKEKVQSVDPRLFGNHTRFFNHSCDPNCKMVVWFVKGTKVAKMYTLRAVEKVSPKETFLNSIIKAISLLGRGTDY